MASFEKLMDHNKRLSVLLFVLLMLLLGSLGGTAGVLWGGNWYTGTIIAVIVGVIYFFISWSFGDSMILSMNHAREIQHEDAPQLWNVVEELSIAGGLPMPRVFLIDEEAMNAFATGRDPQHASVAITRGLMEKLNREELQGVMAHEMSHVRNYDIRFSMLMAVLVGSIVLICDVLRRSLFFGSFGRRRSNNSGGGKFQAVLAIAALVLSILAPLFAAIIQLAVSRQREYLADASAVELTRNPKGLVHALQKLSGDPEKLKGASRGTQHLYIVNPFRKQGRDSLFSTHPSLESRIARIEQIATAEERMEQS